LSQAEPALKQPNLKGLGDASGIKCRGCQTQPKPIFESRAVYTIDELKKNSELMEKLSGSVIEKMGTVLGVAAKTGFGAFDCKSMCDNPITGGGRAVTNLFTAGVKYFTNDKNGAAADVKSAAAKAACIAALYTPAGYAGCLACCGTAKFVGV